MEPVLAPQCGVYLEYIPSSGVSYKEAASDCKLRKYFGLQGSLAMVPNDATQALLLRALGPKIVAWLGATGVPAVGGALWSWASTPPVTFFKGSSTIGISTGFSLWGSDQPKTPIGNTLGLAITADGTWAALDVSSSSATGYFCQYNYSSKTPSAFFGGAATLTPEGCFPQPCSYTDGARCALDSACSWSGTACSVTNCAATTDHKSCNALATCYYDVKAKTCRSAPASICPTLKPSDCALSDECEMSGGKCHPTTCSKQADKLSCNSEDDCQWGDDNHCTKRLCGANKVEDCVQDPMCQWSATGGCSPILCVAAKNATACNGILVSGAKVCDWQVNAVPQCQVSPCGYSDQFTCLANAACDWNFTTKVCARSMCSGFTEDQCEKGQVPGCSVRDVDDRCVRSICNVNSSDVCKDKSHKDVCIWSKLSDDDDQGCQVRNLEQMSASLAAAADAGVCKEKVAEMLALKILLPVLIILLALGLGWMIYRQRKTTPQRSGYNFNNAGQELSEKLNDEL